MPSVNDIKNQIQDLSAEVDAILEVATEESRELTGDEAARIDEIQGSADGESGGLLKGLTENLSRLKKIESRKAAMLVASDKQASAGNLPAVASAPAGSVNMQAVRVPVAAQRHAGNLTSFKGADALQEAHLAGLFYLAAFRGNVAAREELQGYGVQMAQQVGNDALGGYAVPQILETSIIRLVEEFGVFRQNTRVIPMGPGSMLLPRRTAGYTAYFTAELATPTTSDWTLDQIHLVAQKLMVLSEMSSELPEDATAAIGNLITQEIATAFAYKEDYVGFLGDGTATDGNITGVADSLGAAGIVTAAGQTFDSITGNELNEMVGLLPRFPGMAPKWFCHSSFHANVMQRIALAAGGNATTNWEAGSGPSFLGYPVVFTQVMTNPAPSEVSPSAFPVFFGDLSMSSTMGDKAGLTMSTSVERKYFDSDSIGIKARERFDIKNHDCGDATNAGAIVGLQMAAV
jgi:HK97 family phage major capsid protein